MEHDLTRDDYEKPRGIVVCDLHIKREHGTETTGENDNAEQRN
jgi:hypothetical protein